ncbi:hypothetical protein D3C80_572010 [compost metagenome]
MKFKLDRSQFQAYNYAESKKHSVYYKHLPWQERLRIAFYLNSIAYNYPLNNPPQMDKSAFTIKKR